MACTTNEKALGASNTESPPDPSNGLDIATVERIEKKKFSTLVARFALAGYALTLSNPADGAAAFYAMRWGYFTVFPSLDAAHFFLMQIGGVR